jgi:hypothetical protein
MGLLLQRNPTFTWPISYRERTDGGRYRQHNFTAVFKRLPQSELEEIQLSYQRLKSDVSRDVPVDSIPTREICNRIWVGWSDIFEEDGTTQIPYSEELKIELMEVEGLADVLVETYIESAAKAKAKN